jgi:hypothetical protein
VSNFQIQIRGVRGGRPCPGALSSADMHSALIRLASQLAHISAAHPRLGGVGRRGAE